MSWWQSLPWSEAAGWACVAFVTVLAVVGTRPRKRNRYQSGVLPPPSNACRRNSTEAVP